MTPWVAADGFSWRPGGVVPGSTVHWTVGEPTRPYARTVRALCGVSVRPERVPVGSDVTFCPDCRGLHTSR